MTMDSGISGEVGIIRKGAAVHKAGLMVGLAVVFMVIMEVAFMAGRMVGLTGRAVGLAVAIPLPGRDIDLNPDVVSRMSTVARIIG